MSFFFYTAAAKAVAGICCVVAVILALIQIVQHLRHYTEPMFQRYIVRIIFMVPVYAICSFASILAKDAAIYITTVRDCYEAWIIYNFMSLCLAYVGGPGAVEVKMQGVVLLPSWTAFTCCLPPMPVNGHFVRVVKRGALQFVFLKPILAALTLVLYATDHYTEGNWSPGGSYLWITVIYNITYTVALYALLLFYLGTHELLAPFRPLLKFVLVKSVIFLTFWQGLFISIAVGAGVVPSAEHGTAIQNFLICCEMLPAAVCIIFAFPWREFEDGTASGKRRLAADVGHAMSIRDLVADTVHQFAPTYQDYVLYSDGTAKPAGQRANGALNADDSDLLSSVEMAGIDAWNGAGGGPGNGGDGAAVVRGDTGVGRGAAGRSRYLANEEDDQGLQGVDGRRGRGGSGGAGAATDAEARWQSISLTPPH